MNAVLFDLDGTLLDTLPDIALSLNQSLAAFGYPACPLDRVRSYVGDGAEKLIERATGEGKEKSGSVYEDFRARYGNSPQSLTEPYEGILPLLHSLKEKGVKLAIVTNKPQEATDFIVRKFFSGLFDFVGGDSGMFPVKPDPALARYCALTLRVPLKECVFVGDGEADVLTAKNAGMKGVSALWGYRTREELERAGADTFANDREELAKILENFLKKH